MILGDNQGCLVLVEDQSFHDRTKHIPIQYHYTRERVAAREVKFTWILSRDNIADIFTKSLPRPSFERFRALIGVGPPPSSS
jgi:hypothetical protein